MSDDDAPLVRPPLAAPRPPLPPPPWEPPTADQQQGRRRPWWLAGAVGVDAAAAGAAAGIDPAPPVAPAVAPADPLQEEFKPSPDGKFITLHSDLDNNNVLHMIHHLTLETVTIESADTHFYPELFTDDGGWCYCEVAPALTKYCSGPDGLFSHEVYVPATLKAIGNKKVQVKQLCAKKQNCKRFALPAEANRRT